MVCPRCSGSTVYRDENGIPQTCCRTGIVPTGPYSAESAVECATLANGYDRRTAELTGHAPVDPPWQHVGPLCAPSAPSLPTTPFIAVWLRGGCMVCGKPDRDGRDYSHDECCDRPDRATWGDWHQLCDLARESGKSSPRPPTQKKEMFDAILRCGECGAVCGVQASPGADFECSACASKSPPSLPTTTGAKTPHIGACNCDCCEECLADWTSDRAEVATLKVKHEVACATIAALQAERDDWMHRANEARAAEVNESVPMLRRAESDLAAALARATTAERDALAWHTACDEAAVTIKSAADRATAAEKERDEYLREPCDQVGCDHDLGRQLEAATVRATALEGALVGPSVCAASKCGGYCGLSAWRGCEVVKEWLVDVRAELGIEPARAALSPVTGRGTP